VPRTQRSVSLAMRSIVQFDGALQSRGPCSSGAHGRRWVPALRSSVRTLQRVRDTSVSYAASFHPAAFRPGT